MNGIRSVLKKDLLYPFINKECPDIICLQETRANPSQVKLSDSFEKDYPFRFWNNHFQKKGYSGTAIFSKIKPIEVTYPDFDNQGRIICAEFENYFLITVYVPNSGSQFDYRVNNWDSAFLEYLKTFTKELIICGDFNVISDKKLDIYNPKIKDSAGTSKEEMKNFGLFLEHFVDSFRIKNPQQVKFSWWSNMYKAREKNNGWRIDYFLISKNLKFEESDILDQVMGSDHAPIQLII